MQRFARSTPITVLAMLAAVAACAEPAPEETEVWEPEPPVVTPGTQGGAPDDAVVLFDGDDLDAWQGVDGGAAKWRVGDGWFEVVPGTGNIATRETFGDVQLHVEWQAPTEIEGEGQGRGNSGIFLQKRYEVQVLDSYDNRTYSNGQAASVYKQHIPLANAMRPPGEWQAYDIVFRAPRFGDDGSLLAPATLTVLHNGVLVQDHVAIEGTTVYIGEPSYEAHAEDAIVLQDHDNPVRFRNIWVRELADRGPEDGAAD
ncbi:MAG TPA: DUF1080 domain-containing protein [Woeseiaceae bacterium]|nr:DUF1080 domain-containing protein [Woeseiaceae bacterium]